MAGASSYGNGLYGRIKYSLGLQFNMDAVITVNPVVGTGAIKRVRNVPTAVTVTPVVGSGAIKRVRNTSAAVTITPAAVAGAIKRVRNCPTAITITPMVALASLQVIHPQYIAAVADLTPSLSVSAILSMITKFAPVSIMLEGPIVFTYAYLGPYWVKQTDTGPWVKSTPLDEIWIKQDATGPWS